MPGRRRLRERMFDSWASVSKDCGADGCEGSAHASPTRTLSYAVLITRRYRFEAITDTHRTEGPGVSANARGPGGRSAMHTAGLEPCSQEDFGAGIRRRLPWMRWAPRLQERLVEYIRLEHV